MPVFVIKSAMRSGERRAVLEQAAADRLDQLIAEERAASQEKMLNDYTAAMATNDITQVKNVLAGDTEGWCVLKRQDALSAVVARDDSSEMVAVVMDYMITHSLHDAADMLVADLLIGYALADAHPTNRPALEKTRETLKKNHAQYEINKSYINAVHADDIPGTKKALNKGADITAAFNRAVNKAGRYWGSRFVDIIIDTMKERYAALKETKPDTYALYAAADINVVSLSEAFEKCRIVHKNKIKAAIAFFSTEQNAHHSAENKERLANETQTRKACPSPTY